MATASSASSDRFRRRGAALVVWGLATAGATAAMLPLRPQLDKAHVALVYLLVVLGAAAKGGRRIGTFIAIVTFLAFNFFFVPPFHTFSVADRLDWLVLLAYLVTASVAAELLTRAEREAAERIRLAADAEHAKAVLESDRLKDAVLAAVSHDLRTPLTNIKALANEIGDEGDERALIIGVEAERLNRYVAGLLDLSALNSGALRINLETVPVEDVVGAAIAQVTAAINGRTLHTRVAESEVLLVRCDFVYTARILANLIENAHKYSPAVEAIDVDARRANDRIEIAVSDRGSGIPESERRRVFEPFYRPRDAAPDGSSAGLGLAIARRLAEAQGGALRLQERHGGGSVFILALPAVELTDIGVRPAS